VKKYYSLTVNNDDHTADLYIFGDIVDSFETGLNEAWDMDLGESSGLSIAKDLKGLSGVSTINVHINSMGGYTSEGLAIYNLLKCRKEKVCTFCDGFACSAASLIFMAGSDRVMGSASALMIHNAWTQAEGNAAQLKQQADVLSKISQAAGNAYAEKVSISRKQLDALLDGENHEGTWILPEEAVEMGFATKISEETVSSIANQSAMKQIIGKVTAKPSQEKPAAAFDYAKLAGMVAGKLKESVNNSQEEKPAQKTILNFLGAISHREG
jgi:ATP-dependent Clp protease protease subunit